MQKQNQKRRNGSEVYNSQNNNTHGDWFEFSDTEIGLVLDQLDICLTPEVYRAYGVTGKKLSVIWKNFNSRSVTFGGR